MNKMFFAAAIAIGFGIAMAADPSEKDVPTKPLTIYSGGISAGAFRGLNDELDTKLKLSFTNMITFRENLEIFADANWFGLGKNFGGDFGFDLMLAQGDFRPFFGAGFGVLYIDDEDQEFGDNIGPSGTFHFGTMIDVSKTVHLRIRVPFHIVANKRVDQMVGVELGLLFSDPYRKVKELQYD